MKLFQTNMKAEDTLHPLKVPYTDNNTDKKRDEPLLSVEPSEVKGGKSLYVIRKKKYKTNLGSQRIPELEVKPDNNTQDEEYFSYEDFMCDRLERYRNELRSLHGELKQLGRKGFYNLRIPARSQRTFAKRNQLMNTSVRNPDRKNNRAFESIREGKEESMEKSLQEGRAGRTFRIHTLQKRGFTSNKTRNGHDYASEIIKPKPAFQHSLVYNTHYEESKDKITDTLFNKIMERRKVVKEKERKERDAFFKQKLKDILSHFEVSYKAFPFS